MAAAAPSPWSSTALVAVDGDSPVNTVGLQGTRAFTRRMVPPGEWLMQPDRTVPSRRVVFTVAELHPVLPQPSTKAANARSARAAAMLRLAISSAWSDSEPVITATAMPRDKSTIEVCIALSDRLDAGSDDRVGLEQSTQLDWAVDDGGH